MRKTMDQTTTYRTAGRLARTGSERLTAPAAARGMPARAEGATVAAAARRAAAGVVPCTQPRCATAGRAAARRAAAGILALMTGWSSAAGAHHGITAQFDTSTTFEIAGTVTELEFVNPHAYVYFDVTGPAGERVPWRCELRAATVLRRSGWSEEMFGPGTTISVLGSPDRRDPQTCYLVEVTFANGLTVERYGQLDPEDVAGIGAAARTGAGDSGDPDDRTDRPARLANGQPNIGGDWARPQRLLSGQDVFGTGPIAQARNAMGMGAAMGAGAGVQPTAAGTAAVEGYQWQDNPRFACMAVNIFADWTFDQHVNRIVQEDDRITLMYGFMDIVRIIRLDSSEHPDDIEPSRAGHSIGHWEDDVLIVDTVGFAPGYLETRNPIMHSDRMRVVERFSYDHEARTLTRSWDAADPAYFTGRYTGRDSVEIADIPFEPYNCTDLTNEHIAAAEAGAQP